MTRPLGLLLGAVITMAACASPVTGRQWVHVEFLTRSGCPQTKIMRARFDQAIKANGAPIPYAVVDIDALAATDQRKGYPTPTILVGGADLFGMPAPTPPFPEPT